MSRPVPLGAFSAGTAQTSKSSSAPTNRPTSNQTVLHPALLGTEAGGTSSINGSELESAPGQHLAHNPHQTANLLATNEERLNRPRDHTTSSVSEKNTTSTVISTSDQLPPPPHMEPSFLPPNLRELYLGRAISQAAAKTADEHIASCGRNVNTTIWFHVSVGSRSVIYFQGIDCFIFRRPLPNQQLSSCVWRMPACSH